MKRRHKSSGMHKCARFTKALSFEGLHTKIDFDAHNKATKDAFAEARKNYPQANKFRRRSLAEEKQLIRSFQASRRAIASLRQIEEATKVLINLLQCQLNTVIRVDGHMALTDLSQNARSEESGVGILGKLDGSNS